jgi:hypothetical protein
MSYRAQDSCPRWETLAWRTEVGKPWSFEKDFQREVLTDLAQAPVARLGCSPVPTSLVFCWI